MPVKLKKKPKIDIADDATIRAIYIEYFSTIGQTYGRVEPYGGTAWRADFHVKYGTPEYRKRAWADVREEVKGLIPGSIFKALDEHFTDGTGERFLNAFSLEDRERMHSALNG